MAVDATLSPYKRFQAALLPNPEVDKATYDRVHQDPELHAASLAYQKALEEGNFNKIRETVYNLATSLADNETLRGYDIRPEDIRTDLEKQFGTSFGEQQTKQTNLPQPAQAPSVLSGLGKMFGEGKETPIAGQMSDITPSLHTLQEEQLLREFDDAVAHGDETKISQLLSENNTKLKLEGEDGLLRQQLELSLKNLEQLDPEQLRQYRLNREGIAKVTQQIQNQAKKRDTMLKNEKAHIPSTPAEIETDRRRQEQKAKAEAHAAALRMEAQKADTTEKKRAAYQALVRHQIAQTNRYPSLFEEIYEEGSHDQLLGLQRVFLARAEAIQNAYRRQMFAGTQAVQEEQNQQAQQRQQPNGVQKILQKTGRKEFGNLAKQGFKDIGKGFGQAGKKAISAAVKKGFSAAMKFLFASPPYIGWWIVGILLALLIIVAVIIIIISLFNQQNQTSAKPTPIPGVTLALTTDPPGQTHYANGQDIKAIIDIKYTGQYSLVVTDKDPANANVDYRGVTGRYSLGNNATVWYLDANKPLPDSTATQKHWQFIITFAHVGKDFVFHNEATTTYAIGSGPQTGPSPTPGGKPSAGGYCSPGNLANHFGSTQAGQIASCICKYESGGDPSAVNKACLVGKTADWSVGLFQINLDTNPQRCSGAFSSVGLVCKIADNRTLNRCTQSLLDPTNNINAAVNIYHASHNSWENGWRAEKGKCF